jgi:two-component system osmolarity sensor histidine kinase EnvZ
MRRERSRPTLSQQYARWLAVLFIALEVVTAAAALAFIFLPMARRAADDLAGLMVLSAQTWSELPPETRPVFEEELARGYQLALRPDMRPPTDTGLGHGFYIRFLEQAFERRLGYAVFFLEQVGPDGERWLWTVVPGGGRPIGVGFSMGRMQTHPLGALAVALLVGTLLVGLLSWWLARRIALPVARLEVAASQLAAGANPALLPESGPRELADLASHFNHMAIQVRELIDARTTLFAGVSHDLRTPLARMRLAIEMLTLKPEPALLHRLEHDIAEMDALIGQMLQIARGLSTEMPRDFELCGWLRARAHALGAVADSAGARLTVQCNDAVQVHAAPGMLARVIDNLLGNALRYASGPIELTGEQLPPQAPGRSAGVRIGVLDRGPGIPRDQLATAFRPFHRVGAPPEAGNGAFGLGLAIVRQLAHANGWQVSLEARAGGGLAAWVVVNGAGRS